VEAAAAVASETRRADAANYLACALLGLLRLLSRIALRELPESSFDSFSVGPLLYVASEYYASACRVNSQAGYGCSRYPSHFHRVCDDIDGQLRLGAIRVRPGLFGAEHIRRISMPCLFLGTGSLTISRRIHGPPMLRRLHALGRQCNVSRVSLIVR
jgi:hypothetical protein